MKVRNYLKNSNKTFDVGHLSQGKPLNKQVFLFKIT